MSTTPIYELHYQLLGNPPDGPSLGFDLADDVEAQLARIDGLMAGWADWTPGWAATGANPVVGNGVWAGRYKVAGNLCSFWWSFVWGSTTNPGSGAYTWSLPPGVTARSSAATISLGFQDSSTGAHSMAYGTTVATGTTYGARYVGGGQVGPGAPFTWASPDRLQAWGFAEIN